MERLSRLQNRQKLLKAIHPKHHFLRTPRTQTSKPRHHLQKWQRSHNVIRRKPRLRIERTQISKLRQAVILMHPQKQRNHVREGLVAAVEPMPEIQTVVRARLVALQHGVGSKGPQLATMTCLFGRLLGKASMMIMMMTRAEKCQM